MILAVQNREEVQQSANWRSSSSIEVTMKFNHVNDDQNCEQCHHYFAEGILYLSIDDRPED